jgi:O-antigen/teichoic acid export membrane protein
MESARGLTHRTMSGLLWTAWGKGAYAALTLLTLIVLARLLSPKEFGTVSAALVVIEFSSIFSRLGLGPAVVQRQQLEPRHLQAAFTGSLLLGFIVGAAIWLLASRAAAFFHNAQVEPVLKTLAWVFPVKGISAVAESLMLRDLRFRWMANMDVALYAFSNCIVGISLALAGFGVWALVGAAITQTVMRSAVLLYAHPPRLGFWPEWPALKEMLHFGSGFTVARVANLLAVQGDNLVVGHWLGPAALGVYGRAYNLMAMPASTVGKVLDEVLFPTMARLQDDVERLALAYRRGVAVIALVALPASVVFVVLAPELVLVALGPRWVEVITPFQILAAGTLFRTSYKMSDALARSTGVVYRRARRQIIYAALVIGAACVGQQWGITGVAIGVLGALTVNFLLMAQLSLAVCRTPWGMFWAAHRPSVPLAAAAGTVAWAVATILRHWAIPPLAILSLAGCAAVGSAVWLIRRFPHQCLGSEGIWTWGAMTSFLSRTRGRTRELVVAPARARV